MPDREPALLRDETGAPPAAAAGRAPSEPTGAQDRSVSAEADLKAMSDAARPAHVTGRSNSPTERRGRPGTVTVHVVGFWKRLGAAMIDLAIVTPVALILTWIAGAIAGVHLPESRTRRADFWLDLALSSDPALMMAFGLLTAIGLVYLLVFQITTGRTVGMRLLGMRIVDVYGDPPSSARCAVRTLGYLASAATLWLGFLWIGFDREKRGLHDWLAGTYVIRS